MLLASFFLAMGLPNLVKGQLSTMIPTEDATMNMTMMNDTLTHGMNETMYEDLMTGSPTEGSSQELLSDEMMMEEDDTPSPTMAPATQAPLPASTATFSISLSAPTATEPPTAPQLRSCVANPVTNAEIQIIRTAIEDFIAEESNTNYRAKFVRLGFHDCVGGCDGCVDMSDPENAGLEVPITALDAIVAEHENECISRADIWALAALVGAEVAQDSLDFPMVWVGRQNCGAEDPMNGPPHQMPSADMDVHGLLDFFSNQFSFEPQQVVALMGAHSIGRVDEDNSGFVGRGWDDDNEELDNDYYRQLDDGVPWRQVNAGRFQWEGGDGGSGDADEDGIIMMNVDISLVRDFSDDLDSDGDVNCRFRNRGGGNGPVCPNAAQTIGFVEDYQDSNSLFLNDFRDVFSRMLVHGYDTSGGCDSTDPCRFPGSQEVAVSRSRTASTGSNSGLKWGDFWA